MLLTKREECQLFINKPLTINHNCHLYIMLTTDAVHGLLHLPGPFNTEMTEPMTKHRMKITLRKNGEEEKTTFETIIRLQSDVTESERNVMLPCIKFLVHQSFCRIHFFNERYQLHHNGRNYLTVDSDTIKSKLTRNRVDYTRDEAVRIVEKLVSITSVAKPKKKIKDLFSLKRVLNRHNEKCKSAWTKEVDDLYTDQKWKAKDDQIAYRDDGNTQDGLIVESSGEEDSDDEIEPNTSSSSSSFSSSASNNSYTSQTMMDTLQLKNDQLKNENIKLKNERHQLRLQRLSQGFVHNVETGQEEPVPQQYSWLSSSSASSNNKRKHKSIEQIGEEMQRTLPPRRW